MSLHGARKAYKFVDCFSLHPEPYQKSSDLRGRDAALENLLHGRFRVVSRQIFARGEPFQIGQKRHDIVILPAASQY